MSKLKDKLLAIWHIVRADLYLAYTLHIPKYDSEYMQAGWFHCQMPEDDPYFLYLVKEQLQKLDRHNDIKKNNAQMQYHEWNPKPIKESVSATETELKDSTKRRQETPEKIAHRIANDTISPVREHFDEVVGPCLDNNNYLPDLLKDYVGCYFYTPIFGCEVKLMAVNISDSHPLLFELDDSETKQGLALTATGALHKGGECMIFPCTERRDWAKWKESNKFVVTLNTFQQDNATFVGPGTCLRVHNPQELQVITDKLRQYMIKLADEFNLQID